ncbi:MAG: hypothetical protein R6X02_10905 [Enhygromyxa sp.]
MVLPGVLLSLAMAACGVEKEPPEPLEPPNIDAELVYESDRIQVRVEPGMTFCQGDGVKMDTHIERISSQFEIDVPPVVAIWVVRNNMGKAIADWCPVDADGSIGGCFSPWMIMAKRWAVPHELNHATLRTLNPSAHRASEFWYEAYASAWETHETTFDVTGLAEQTTSAAYNRGDHLVRWLVETHGVEAVADFYASLDRYRSREQVDAAFADVFGVSYDQSLAQYEKEAPPLYPGFGWCDSVEVVDVPIGETTLTFRADCAARDTYAFAEPPITDAMYVRRVLRLAQPADLVFEFSSDVGILNIHPCFETPVESEDDPRLSSLAWYENIGSGVPPMGPDASKNGVPAGNSLFEFVVPIAAPRNIEAIIYADPAVGG